MMRYVNEQKQTIAQILMQLTSVFHASVLLLKRNYVMLCQSSLLIHLAIASWIDSYLIMLWRNSRSMTRQAPKLTFLVAIVGLFISSVEVSLYYVRCSSLVFLRYNYPWFSRNKCLIKGLKIKTLTILSIAYVFCFGEKSYGIIRETILLRKKLVWRLTLNFGLKEREKKRFRC